MNNILITGANGQLGSELHRLAPTDNANYFFTDIHDLNITDKQQVNRFVADNQIRIIVNCAAYTQVDQAEDDAEKARLVNKDAVVVLAEAAYKHSATLIHISTDYVFDGSKNLPYSEKDAPNPRSIYGTTKLEGEKAIEESGCNYLIIRTSWLYSSFGNNFLKTMRRLTAERANLNVVFDQVGTPTYAADLAKTILAVINSGKLKSNSGVYHFSNEGVCSWYDFAVEIALAFGHDCAIQPCYSDDFPSKVKRPAFSVLDKTKIKNQFGINIPHWRESMLQCVEVLKNEN